jgi:hypothetical protein
MQRTWLLQSTEASQAFYIEVVSLEFAYRDPRVRLPLPFALIWRKDNASPLLEKFVADVRLLSEVEAYSKHCLRHDG